MARTKITPGSSETDEPVEQSTALAPSTSNEVGAPASYDPGYYDDTSRDVDIPVLGLVNNVGNLAKTHRNQAGNFVLGEKVLGPAVDVVPVALVKFFAERFRNGRELKNGTPEFATRRIFASATEAANFKLQDDGPGKGLGYFVDFDNKCPNRVEEAGRIGYLVVAPEGADPVDFPLKRLGGTLRFALAKCSYQRGGFRNVWRSVFNHADKLAKVKEIAVRGMAHAEVFNKAQAWDGIWTLTSKEESGNGNFWFEPRIAKKAKLDPADIAWIAEEYGSLRA